MHFDAVPIGILHDLLTRAEEYGLSSKARERLSWIIHYREHGCSVPDTCKHFGINRVTFYRLLQKFDPANPETLEDQSRRPHHIHVTVSPETVALIRQYRLHSPQIGKETIAALLKRDHGIALSESVIGRVIAREGMFFGDTPLHSRKRMERGIVPPAPAFGPVEQHVHLASITQCEGGEDKCGEQECLFCHVKVFAWPRVKRTLLIGSVLANIAFISLFALTALLEGKQSGKHIQIKASVMSGDTDDSDEPQIYTLVPLP